MINRKELKEVDKIHVERINKHLPTFPTEHESIKLFTRARDKIARKQFNKDYSRFTDREFLKHEYFSTTSAFPIVNDSKPSTEQDRALFYARCLLYPILEILAYRTASLSLILEVYEHELFPVPKTEPKKKSKNNLRRIK